MAETSLNSDPVKARIAELAEQEVEARVGRLALADAEKSLTTAKIKARIKQIDAEGNEVMMRFDTTPGRVRLGALLPLNAKAPVTKIPSLNREASAAIAFTTVGVTIELAVLKYSSLIISHPRL